MDHGRVVAAGTPTELKRRVSGDVIGIGVDRANVARTVELLEGLPGVTGMVVAGDTLKLTVEAGEKVLPLLLPRLVDAGIPVQRVEMNRPTLDEVFQKTTGRALTEIEAESEAGGGGGGWK
jgi:ABC-2 type transport system ATP-binding protein